MKSWKEIPENSDFSVHNIPFGIFSTSRRSPRIGVAIGKDIIDVAALNGIGLLEDLEVNTETLVGQSLNHFIKLGKEVTEAVRLRIQELLCDPTSVLKDHPQLFISQENATMHLPVEIGDYTDFYSSMEHATNVGKMFRDPENALLPNWKHLPVAYHGRSSSIIVSGTDFHRPKGQILNSDNQPIFSPSKRLDFELELGFVVGKNSELGQHVAVKGAEEYIFGFVLVNDWSARDIQKWEYVPLGPFLGKNFATSISPWIVTTEALKPYQVAGPPQVPPVLSYLKGSELANYDIQLEVAIQPKSLDHGTTITKSNSRYLYWNAHQQLAHHTINGCNINIGDLMASGTISGPTADSLGSLLELSWGGQKTINLNNGIARTFLEDEDLVIITGHAGEGEGRVGFGELRGRVLPPV